MKNKPRNIARDIDGIRAFEGEIDALIADQTDLFAAGDDRLHRSCCGQIIQAVLQAMFGEQPELLAQPEWRHGATESVVDNANARRLRCRQSARRKC